MDAKPEVRPLAIEDAKQVIDLLQDVSTFNVPPDKVSELAKRFIEQNGSYACVVSQGSKIHGFGSVFLCNRIRGGRSATIEDMVVASEMRGKGIGKMVLGELLKYARVQGCFKVTLESSNAARDFYRAAGFKDGGQSMKLLF